MLYLIYDDYKKADDVMWLNDKQVTELAIDKYRTSLQNTCPNYIVIDDLFNAPKLDEVLRVLQNPYSWQTQQHTYSALYVDSATWQDANKEERFVQRDIWQRDSASHNIAQEFLSYLRGAEFMSLLSRIFTVQLTDKNVADPTINTNYFRLAATDFVEQHADDSPGREVCMLLYLNKDWHKHAGGELSFMGKESGKPISILPLYNRCVLFNPKSIGSEHWVEKLNPKQAADLYRYNVTSWYWGE